jgi:hypothetical protein
VGREVAQQAADWGGGEEAGIGEEERRWIGEWLGCAI